MEIILFFMRYKFIQFMNLTIPLLKEIFSRIVEKTKVDVNDFVQYFLIQTKEYY